MGNVRINSSVTGRPRRTLLTPLLLPLLFLALLVEASPLFLTLLEAGV